MDIGWSEGIDQILFFFLGSLPSLWFGQVALETPEGGDPS